jgi:hypothetical protein
MLLSYKTAKQQNSKQQKSKTTEKKYKLKLKIVIDNIVSSI